MGIGLCQQAGALWSPVFTPYLCESQEESLLGTEAVFGLVGAVFCVLGHGILQRPESNADSTVISGVLTQRETAIQVNVFHRNERAVLISDTASALFKLGKIGGRPPVLEVAFSIELAALVVKAMGQLVANHNSNPAEIDCIICTLIEERRLQNTRREVDVV